MFCPHLCPQGLASISPSISTVRWLRAGWAAAFGEKAAVFDRGSIARRDSVALMPEGLRVSAAPDPAGPVPDPAH